MYKQTNWTVDLIVRLAVGESRFRAELGVDTVLRAPENTVFWAVYRDVNRDVDLAVKEAVRGGLPHPVLSDYLLEVRIEV
jgi:hypothetical protein